MPPFRETALGPRPLTRGRSLILMPDRWFLRTGTFVAPRAGKYTFYGWSGSNPGQQQQGPNGTPYGGAAGNFARKTATLAQGASVSLTVGLAGFSIGYNGNFTPPGSTIISGPGLFVNIPAPTGSPNDTQNHIRGNTPTGGDINLRGGAGGTYGVAGGAGEGSYAGVGAASPMIDTINGYGVGGGGGAPGDVVLTGADGGTPISSGSSPYDLVLFTKGNFPAGGGGGFRSTYGGTLRGVMLGADGLAIVIEGEARV